MESRKVHVLGAALGLCFMLYGAANSAQAHYGELCFGWIHQVQLTSGAWVFLQIDCDLDPCPPPGIKCELVPVDFEPYKWRCGCDGAEDGTCDATLVTGTGGTRGECQGLCSPGTCHGAGSVEWTDQYGIRHRTIICGC